MRSRDLRSHFERKMEFERQERRHVQYIPYIQGEKVFLPRPLCHSRGSGDVRNNEVRSLARGMGLSENHFRCSVRCDHERECDLLCLAMRSLTDCDSDPQVAPPNVIIPSIEKILTDVEQDQSKKADPQWNDEEKKSLEICRDRLSKLNETNRELADTVSRMTKLIDKYW